MNHASQYIKLFGEPTQLGHKRTPHYRLLRRDMGIIFQNLTRWAACRFSATC